MQLKESPKIKSKPGVEQSSEKNSNTLNQVYRPRKRVVSRWNTMNGISCQTIQQKSTPSIKMKIKHYKTVVSPEVSSSMYLSKHRLSLNIISWY